MDVWKFKFASMVCQEGNRLGDGIVRFRNSLAARRIPVGWEMIQICQGCQSLQKITCFKKNDSVTSQTLAVWRYSRWRSRWPTNYKCSFFSGIIDRTDAILVSSIGFSGSENPKNIFNSFPNHHVTLKA